MAQRWQQISLEEARGHPLYGVKNWLALFAFGHVVGPLLILGTLNNSANDAGLTLRQLLSAPSVGNFATGTLLVFGVASFVTLQLMFTKDRNFRTVATTLLVAVWPAFLLMAYFTGGWNLPGFGGDAAKGTFSQLAVVAIWGTYLQRSRRVRVTFENCVVSTEVPASENQEGRLEKGVPAPVPAREALTTGGAAYLKSDSGPSEEFWSEASAELESASRRPGLWARAFSEAQGNESVAMANYLRYRAVELQQQHDMQVEQAQRDMGKAARVAAHAQQAANEAADRRIAAVPGAVPNWVTQAMLVMSGVAVVGIMAAVALPAYQDYTKRRASATKPIQAPAAQLDLSEFTPVAEENQKQKVGQAGTDWNKGVTTPQAGPSVTPSQRPAGSQPLRHPEAVATVKRTPTAAQQAPVMRESEQERAYRAQVEADVKVVSERAVRDYPYLNTPAGKEVLDRIIERRDELIGQGIYPSIALTRAVSDFAPAYAPVVAKDAPQSQTTQTTRPANHNSFPAECRWVTPQDWSCK